MIGFADVVNQPRDGAGQAPSHSIPIAAVLRLIAHRLPARVKQNVKPVESGVSGNLAGVSEKWQTRDHWSCPRGIKGRCSKVY